VAGEALKLHLLADLPPELFADLPRSFMSSRKNIGG